MVGICDRIQDCKLFSFSHTVGPRPAKASAKKSALELPDDWTSVRFAVVPAGNEQIALHNPWRGRFISMSTKVTGSSLEWTLAFWSAKFAKMPVETARVWCL